jgi:L-asparaginase
MLTDMARVALIATGGTIDSLGASRLDLAGYFEGGRRLAEGELVESIPEFGDLATIEEIPFRRVSSSALTTRDWLDLARIVTTLVDRDDCDGIVITHGTNTIEETAYLLHLTVCSSKPIVVTGAMRPANALGADGPLNLLRAVQVATAEEARGHGVLVVMNDAILSARDATKTATYRIEAFDAPDLGPLGYADADGRVVFSHRRVGVSRAGPVFDTKTLEELPRVDVVVSYVGADGVLIDAAVTAGAQGLVSAGTGAGRVTPAEEEALDRAIANGIVVCQSSRVGSGRVVRSPSLTRRRVVAADNLQPWKAKVLLSLALTQTKDPGDIQELFDLL